MSKNLLYIGNKLSKHGSTLTSIDTLGKFFEIEGYKLYYASSKKNKFLRMLDMFYKTIIYCNKVEYVLIDVYSTQNFWYAFLISQSCRILNLKYITKLHGGDLPNRLEKNPYLCNLIFKNSYKITAPSNYLMNVFSKKYTSNLIYIPNTIEINKYNFLKREIHQPKLLWVRSFSNIYNPKMAIKVLSILKNDYPNASLTMVGPDKENLITDCKLYTNELNLEVNFTGKLSKEEWIELSKNCNIFINTTHFDNTPISVIEAMALGLPIVSTNVGGIPYLLKSEENALLTNDDDAIEMANSIKKLTENPVLVNQLTTNARAIVEEFDWDKVKHRWFEILK
ncbi:glycosyltransferase family 4 protein [Flavobacterium sp.]|uniref:glycosyltransferase family 4 protein n=1 Tax=Flavobacterium sp. TaxID=239 RepID=UPI003753BC68